MLPELLTALASAAAASLGGAMGTEGWQAAREGVIRLFRRAKPEVQSRVAAQLDSGSERVGRSDEPDRVRRALIGVWQLELEELLEAHPELAEELKAWHESVLAQLPAAQRTWVQTNIAHANATIYAVQGGNIVHHQTAPSRD